MNLLKQWTSGVVVMLALFLPAHAAAQIDREELAAIRAEIEATGAHWTAGETDIAAMPREEFKARLRSLEDLQLDFFIGEPGDRVAYDVHVNAPVADPEASRFDWHDVDGVDWTTSAKDQMMCGSCSVFALIGVAEARANISAGQPDWDLDLSEQNLLSCTPGSSCTMGTWNTKTLLPTLKNKGVPEDDCHPYTGTDGKCSDACEDADSTRFFIESGNWLPSVKTMLAVATVEDAKEALVSGPVAMSFCVPGSFMYYTGGVYEGVPTAAELLTGWHTVAVVGWDDHESDDSPPSWIVKNSWGTWFGDNGFFEIQRGGKTLIGTQATTIEVIAVGPTDVDVDSDTDTDTDSDTDADSDSDTDTEDVPSQDSGLEQETDTGSDDAGSGTNDDEDDPGCGCQTTGAHSFTLNGFLLLLFNQ
jgi:C1A family cysteine protease